jgi:hypothetical protein
MNFGLLINLRNWKRDKTFPPPLTRPCFIHITAVVCFRYQKLLLLIGPSYVAGLVPRFYPLFFGMQFPPYAVKADGGKMKIRCCRFEF